MHQQRQQGYRPEGERFEDRAYNGYNGGEGGYGPPPYQGFGSGQTQRPWGQQGTENYDSGQYRGSSSAPRYGQSWGGYAEQQGGRSGDYGQYGGYGRREEWSGGGVQGYGGQGSIDQRGYGGREGGRGRYDDDYSQRSNYGSFGGQQGSYGAQGGYGSQGAYGRGMHGDYGSQGRYGTGMQGGYGSPSGYGSQGGYGSQSGYGSQGGYGGGMQSDWGSQGGYGGGTWPGEHGSQSGYGTRGGYGSQGQYGSQSGYGGGSQGGYGSATSTRRRGGRDRAGPKGYQRSDERLREEIVDRLVSQTDADLENIEVQVSNGEVTLSGTVQDRQTRHMIEDIADDIWGVHDVTNNIRVQSDRGGREGEKGNTGRWGQGRDSDRGGSDRPGERAGERSGQGGSSHAGSTSGAGGVSGAAGSTKPGTRS